MEPKAPPLLRNRAAAVFAALGLLVPTLAVSLAFLGLAGKASAVEPQPDAAPQAPAVSPDPAPQATNPPPQQSAPTQPVQVAPQASAPTQQPATPAATLSTTPTQASPRPKAERKTKPARRETISSRPEAKPKPADPSRLLRVDSFLPGVQGDEDSPSHLVLLAAAALLALLMASGSLLSVATRVWPRQLR